MPSTSDGLNDKQRRFIEEYLVDLNATQAAMRAGYSERTAQEQASRLLSNVMVQAEIGKAKAKRSKETGITAERVLDEVASLALWDIADYTQADDKGQTVYKPLDELPKGASRAIKAFHRDEEGRLVYVFHDKAKPLEMLTKHTGGTARISKAEPYKPDPSKTPVAQAIDVANYAMVQVSTGTMDPKLAQAIGGITQALAKIVETSELEKRLQAIESTLASQSTQPVGLMGLEPFDEQEEPPHD